MLKKNAWSCSIEAEQAFKTLKELMIQALVLALPYFYKPFVIKCDTLGTRIERVLMQDGHLIAYYSRALHGKNLALSTYVKELLALIAVVHK